MRSGGSDLGSGSAASLNLGAERVSIRGTRSFAARSCARCLNGRCARRGRAAGRFARGCRLSPSRRVSRFLVHLWCHSGVRTSGRRDRNCRTTCYGHLRDGVECRRSHGVADPFRCRELEITQTVASAGSDAVAVSEASASSALGVDISRSTSTAERERVAKERRRKNMATGSSSRT